MALETRKVGPAQFRALIDSVDVAARTATLVWTTGAKVLRSTWDGPVFEELSLDPTHVRMTRLQSGSAPLLSDHYASVANVIGVIESAALSATEGTCRVRFAKAEDDPEADKIFRKVCDKIVRNVSVGYRTYKSERLVDPKSAVVTMRAVDWEPYEVSMVGIGADAGAGTRSESAVTNDCEVISSRSAGPKEGHEMTPEEQAKIDAELAKRSAELKSATEKAALAERARMSAIQTSCRAAKLDPSFAEKMIADGTSVDAARAAVIDEMMARDAKAGATFAPNDSGITMGESAREKFVKGATARMLAIGSDGSQAVQQARALAAKLTAEGKPLPEPLQNVGQIERDVGEFRGASIADIARRCLALDGVKTDGMTRSELAALAFTHRSSGMGTISDFPVLLENVMYKTLLAAYATTPDTWSRFCKTDTVVDFRVANRYRASSLQSLETVTEHGEIHSVPMSDGEKSTISTSTKAGILAITRQLFVNDDMGALTDLATKLGRSARRGIEEDVYALLALNSGLGPTMADGYSLFHANHANISTGAALSVAALDADRVTFLSQRDVGNHEYLDLAPAALLLPVGLGASARVINRSTFDPTTGTATLQRPNSVLGLFSDIIDTPRLTGTRRYIFADPSVAAALTVVFLEGSGQGPQLSSRLGWNIDGTELKVVIDYKAQAFDWRGAITNAGV
jgi:hypothetical protein